MDTGSLPRYRIQIYQLLSILSPTRFSSKNAGLSVSYTNYQTPPQNTSAANLKLQLVLESRQPPVSTSVSPPNPTLTPVALISFNSVSHILLLRKATVIWPKVSFSFRFISLCLSDTHSASNIFLSTFSSNTLNLCSSLSVRDHVSQPYNTTGNIIGPTVVLYVLTFAFLESRQKDKIFSSD